MSAFTVAVPESEGVRVRAGDLAALTAAIFERVGVPPGEARVAADALVSADSGWPSTTPCWRCPTT